MQNITIDAEFKALIPALSAEEYSQLEANILKDGCRDPLVLWHDVLIDGHNRFEICKANGLAFKTVQLEFKSRDDVMDWMDANQLGRRNLKPDQFTLLLGRRYNRAKKKQGGTGANQNKQQSGKNCHSAKTAESLADQHGVSEKTVRNAGKFADAVDKLKEVAPEITESINKGTAKPKKDVIKAAEMLESDPTAAKQILSSEKTVKEIEKEQNKAKRKEAEKKQVEAAAEAEQKLPVVYHADCMAMVDKIPDIDLLIADPPYFTDGDFTEQIARYLYKVKDTGQAYVFAGADPQELEAYLAISSKLDLCQVLIWNYNNTGQRQPNDRYTSNYQVCFYFRGKKAPKINKPADGKEQYACQTINAPDARVDDRYHKWQKPLELMERIIRNSSKPDDFIFDPFAGSGSTLVAAAKLGRLAAGCEVDAEAVKICIERGCKHGQI